MLVLGIETTCDETACGGSREDAAAIGAEAGRELKCLAPADFFAPPKAG